jgi:hypothetical protein
MGARAGARLDPTNTENPIKTRIGMLGFGIALVFASWARAQISAPPHTSG